MTTTNGKVRTRQRATLPAKVEAAFRMSATKRSGKTSRLDFAAGYEDGYTDALEDFKRGVTGLLVHLRKELHAP